MRIGRFSGALPLVLMTVLILAVGAFATVRQDAFLTSFNINNLLLMTMPLALVSLGQTCALLVGGFDVSVAALMTFCVVLASYTMTFDTSGWALVPGGLALIAVGLATGIFNAVIDPRPQASVDHRDARDVQHPRRCLAPPPRSPRRPHLERRHQRSHDERRLPSHRLRRRRGPRRARRHVAVPHASGPRHESGRPRRDVVAPARDGNRPHRHSRVRHLLGDGVARRLLPRGPGTDRLAAHRQLRAREHRRSRPRRRSALRREGLVRRALCSRRSSSR